jgi:TctA family transporter
MKLITAHRILISFGILFSLILVIHSVGQYQREASTTTLLMGVAFSVLAVVLGVYLATLKKHLKI